MSEKQKMVVVVTQGFQDERASVAWSVANGGLGMGFEVTMFLVSSAVDIVRKGAADAVRMNPFDPPMKDMVDDFMANGGAVLACPPCAKLRGYGDDDLIDGVIVTGSGAMHALVKEGAATMSF